MRVQKRAARRNSKFNGDCLSPPPEAANLRSPESIGANLIPTGTTGELIRETPTEGPCWLFYQENDCKPAYRAEFEGQLSADEGVNPSILRAITLPSRRGSLGTTAELFRAVRESLTNHGLPEEAALPATYFVLSTWFADSLPVAPCLTILGPRPEASHLLQLLGCMVRHPLQLREVTRVGLFSLPMHLQLTLLISQEHLNHSISELLSASNNPNAFVPWKGGLQNIFCAKVMYRGYELVGEDSSPSTLRIHLPPSRARLPILDATDAQKISDELQPQLLAYRCRNMTKVRESQFDLPQFSSEIRILARVLGAPIVDAPELQAALDPLLREYHEENRVAHWRDLRCVAIEAALFHCHESEEKVYLGKITLTANAILQARGESIEFKPKEIGTILRSQGLSPKRDMNGFALVLNDKIRRQIHQLAGRFDVAAIEEGLTGCSHCHEIVASGTTQN